MHQIIAITTSVSLILSFLIKYQFLKIYPKPIVFGNIYSMIHATLVSLIHLYLLVPSFPMYRRELYLVVYSLSLTYVLIDYIHLFENSSEYKPMLWKMFLFHHLAMFGFVLLGMYDTLYQYESGNGFYHSLGFLTEISTPLLNHIQIQHGRVSMFEKKMLAYIYFWCRPVNLTYMCYITSHLYGLYSPISLMVYAVTLLNYHWFYRIHYKIRETIT